MKPKPKSPLYIKHKDVEALRSCIAVLESVLAQYADPSPMSGVDPVRIRLHGIISRVATFYNIDTSDLFTDKRTGPLASLRAWTIGLALELKVCRMKDVASYLGRTRSNMCHIYKKWRLDLSTNQDMQQAFNYLARKPYESK